MKKSKGMGICDNVYMEFPSCWDHELYEAYRRNLSNGNFNNAWDILQRIRLKFLLRNGSVVTKFFRWEYFRSYDGILAFKWILK